MASAIPINSRHEPHALNLLQNLMKTNLYVYLLVDLSNFPLQYHGLHFACYIKGRVQYREKQTKLDMNICQLQKDPARQPQILIP